MKTNKSGYEIICLKDVGLCRRLNYARFSTSVDGIFAYKKKDEIRVSLLEIKTRSSAIEIQRLDTVRQQGSIFHVSPGECKGGDNLMYYRLIPDESYRQQLVHHCAVFNRNEILYVESTIHGIKYAVHVTFPDSLLNSYRKGVIDPLTEGHVIPFIKSIKLGECPESINDFGFAVDWHTVR